ncbi:methylated-DNA--[protein]-cysteine S-methyltransferase, partial [Corynebacterium stationis]
VWALLQEIPYGETMTYGEIAQQLGNKHLAQRVGQVVGRNPVSIIIPCHRVIGSDGSLTGYAGGLDRKRFLLELEEPAEVTETRLF